MTELCLTLLCSPALEERVLDTLLMSSEISLFTSTAAAAHGLAHDRLSATEQVLGLAKMTRIDALLPEAHRETVLTMLRQVLQGGGVRYWLTPITEAGELL
ncbi:DUF3240 family protein [Janthinobacterium tructae]